MIGPTLQTRWDWRAAGNFICGGTGTGLMIIAAAFALSGEKSAQLSLLASLFVACGLGLVWLEIGRPMRAMNVFRNPATSWMTREGVIAMGVIPLGLIAFLLDSVTVMLIAALTASGFLYAQARILQKSAGIPAWRTPKMLPLILTTGLAEGMGVLMIVLAILKNDLMLSNNIWLLASALMIIRGIAWGIYRGDLEITAPEQTLTVLEKFSGRFLLAGLFIPLGFAFVAIVTNGHELTLAIITGLCLMLAGWDCKFTVITRAAYTQGYAIKLSPSRNGGKPGPGSKPGWRLPS